ncbi:hypothetical protein [Sulfurirhabdus autotrophica]|uniref:Base plate protein n=1 Tax=Sulfurirhabdus autotrophica TaxID=1706046 RepID=A0A4V2W255_9PROT|nr:hypothetical protein [Sulfurirhabdus autotrophica]TCV86759.1 base plate protein [Sulfurirhabdus autotrophica]
MLIPSAAQLLDMWEGAIAASHTRRALDILSVAYPELTVDALARMPLGQRDAKLMRLRECLFGSSLTVVAACPHCSTQLESTMLVSDIRVDNYHPSNGAQEIDSDGYRIVFRLPASNDLLLFSPDMDSSRARDVLLARCILDVRNTDGEQVCYASLPEHVVSAVAEQMALADPQADLELAFECPACGHSWEAMFDIARFLWREIHAWAMRTLREVHSLARAYGWSESDVLMMSPTRRQMYLELCRQ